MEYVLAFCYKVGGLGVKECLESLERKYAPHWILDDPTKDSKTERYGIVQINGEDGLELEILRKEFKNLKVEKLIPCINSLE